MRLSSTLNTCNRTTTFPMMLCKLMLEVHSHSANHQKPPKTLESPFVQAFVKHTAVGLYSLKQVWQQPATKHGITWDLKQDARLVQELFRSQLPLSVRELQPILLASVQALVDSLKVSVQSWVIGGLLHVEGDGSGRVWGLLNYWHLLFVRFSVRFSPCAHAHISTHPPTHTLSHSYFAWY